MVDDKKQEMKNEGQQKLYRSKSDRMVAGVCGGMSKHWGIDTVLLRIIWVLSVLFGGVGFLLYLAAIIIIPENPNESYSESDGKSKDDRTVFWGSTLIIIGAIILLKQFGLFYYIRYWDIPWKVIWSILLIILGVFLLVNKKESENENTDAGISSSPDKNRSDTNTKKLFRSSSSKMISGVCAGLARYFDLDISVVRISWVLLTLISFGAGIIGYIVLMIVIQEEDNEVEQTSAAMVSKEDK
jgi:phage shock protein C